jgi:hypothetical protein
MAVALGGCEPVDYYPHHDVPERSSDLQQGGPGGYGGNNSDDPMGTSGATGNDKGTSPMQPESPAGPALNTNGQGAFSQTRSYSGAATGGSMSGDPPIGSGTTTTGTAAGH